MVRWSEQEEVPREPFRLRPKHAFILVDLLVIAVLFMAAGRVYVNQYGTKTIHAKQKEREAAKLEGARMIEQADSVATAAKVNLSETTKAHDETFAEVERLQNEIRDGLTKRKDLEQAIFRLSDIVLDLRGRSEGELKNVDGYEKDVASRKQEIDSLRATANSAEVDLGKTQQERQSAANQLQSARAQEAYDPTGRFPSETGVAIRRDLGSTADLTNLEVQHLLWQPGPNVDLGVSLGVGLGAEKPISNKELGLLVSKTLIHRKLGLDIGAGYSMLTETGGSDDNGPYAAAGIRYSPFFKERVHLGLGARATHGELLPYLGVSVGRR